MAYLTLTTTPQSIAGSDLGCVIKADDTFMYGFGDTSPTEGIEGMPSIPLQYDGKQGLIWVWRETLQGSEYLEYFISLLPLKVALTDGNGVSIIADATGSVATVNELQNAIHNGDAYSFDLDGTVNALSSIYLMGITGSKQIHFDLFFANLQKGGIRLWLYEAPTTTADGTAQTPVNMNFASINTTTMSLFLTPTITANGTKKVTEFFPITGVGVNLSPAEGEIAGGRVLKTNTKYLFRIENTDATSCSFGVNFEWHDSDIIL